MVQERELARLRRRLERHVLEPERVREALGKGHVERAVRIEEPDVLSTLAALDDQIAAAMSARGLGKAWTFGREVERASKLNSMLIADARSLSAEWLRGRVLPEATVRDPLQSQVRGLVGLKGSRYALLPVELRIENRGNGTGVAILRIVMIDSRMALIRWVGEVVSDPMRTLSPALTASVASHFADLVLAP